MDNKEFSKELEKRSAVNYLLFSHLLEQSKPLTLVTLDILHFSHFGCGYAALMSIVSFVTDHPRPYPPH